MTIEDAELGDEDTDVMEYDVLNNREAELENEESDVMEYDVLNNLDKDRIIIAIDFGTTFSSVAYTVLPKDLSPSEVHIRKVHCISKYPDYPVPTNQLDTRQDVPTELWYTWDSGDETSDDDSDNDGGPRTGGTVRPSLRCDVTAIQYWGFRVQDQLNRNHITRDVACPLTRFKLHLDNTEITRQVRSDNEPILTTLRKWGVIKDDSDIYADYLTHLLRHTKGRLSIDLDRSLSEELDTNMIFQFVLCVPAKWSVQACRTMQNAVEQAVYRSGFSPKAQEAVRNLFMISEPEAAAECVLAEAESYLYRGDTVVIIDAGGGTIDAVTYKCANDEPLRLSEEVVAPDSELVGASFINKAFKEELEEKLRHELYLVQNGKTIKSIVQKCSTRFKNRAKRTIDVNNPDTIMRRVDVDNLRENPGKRFGRNMLKLTRTMKSFYQPSLDKVEDVLASQLERAASAGHTVKKIILTGGFGQSPSLQSHLRSFLEGRENIQRRRMELIVPREPSTAVARGAVLRALNKRLGPSRVSQCSYGFLQSEPYEPEVFKEHKFNDSRVNKADGERYIDETIRWFIQLGDKVANMQEFAFNVKHTFSVGTKQLKAAEQLWMSDKTHPQHYKRNHAFNKGAIKIGTIVANLTELKDEGLVKAEAPSEFSTLAGSNKKRDRHWVIHYELVMIVEGRSVRFEARWPAQKDRRPGQKHERLLASELVGIASAFIPGTA